MRTTQPATENRLQRAAISPPREDALGELRLGPVGATMPRVRSPFVAEFASTFLEGREPLRIVSREPLNKGCKHARESPSVRQLLAFTENLDVDVAGTVLAPTLLRLRPVNTRCRPHQPQ